MHRVSVIMGIYNCSPYLQEALDSLYSQSFQDFEIILCDDGSEDETYFIAKENAKRHDNIVLLRNEINLGLNSTLNKCLAIAQGEYIARMDGDDISLPDRFEKEVAFLDSHPDYSIISTPMIFFDEDGEFGRGRGGYEPRRKDIIYKPPFCHAPSMIRSSAYRDVDGYTVDPKLLRYEDYNLWMKMYLHGHKGFVLDECLYKMRDDRNAFRRRDFKSRMNGIYAHYMAYKTLKLSFWGLIHYSLLVLIKGIIPFSVYKFFHKRRLRIQ